MTPFEIALLGLTGLLAGISNAIVGGGTLFAFPVILAAGIGPVLANATTTVALLPGSVTSVQVYLPELKRPGLNLRVRAGVAAAGGLLGAVLLLVSGDNLFFALVPWLLGLATFLFTFSKVIVARVFARSPDARNEPLRLVLEFLCAIYGGYFGAAIGILLLAAMALTGEHNAQAANGQRILLAGCINCVAAVLFIAMGVVSWPVALIVGVGAITGGHFGGKMVKLIPAPVLRHIVTAAGVFFTLYYSVRVYG